MPKAFANPWQYPIAESETLPSHSLLPIVGPIEKSSIRTKVLALLLGVPLALGAWAAPATTANADSAASASSDLDATHEVPWNPAHRMPARSGWERAVLLPGRIVSLPMSGLGYAAKNTAKYLEGSAWIPRGPNADSTGRRRIWSVQPPHIADRAGLGAAAELRAGAVRGPAPLVAVRYAATILHYNSALVTLAPGPLALQYGYDWRPQDPFYGIGQETSDDSVSAFATQNEFARGTARFGWGPRTSKGRSRAQLSLWGGPRSQVTRTGREDGRMSWHERFPALAAATLDRRVEHLVYGANLTADWRSGEPHWGRGVRVQIAAERYDPPIQALALKSSRADGAQFTTVSIEGEGAVSFMRDPRTLRVMVRVNDERVTAGRERFLLPDLSRLGGRVGLSGFAPGRFRDFDLLHTRVMYVFPLARLFEFEVHSEFGAVYADVWKDAALGTLETSQGFSLRARDDDSVHGALGLDFSREGFRIRYALGSVE